MRVVGHGQHRRLVPVAARELAVGQPPPAGQHLGAGGLRRLHHALDLVELGAARTSGRRRPASVGSPTLSSLHRRGEVLEELVGDLLVQVHALVADADLAAVLEARLHRRLHRGADVGVLGDDERRLAAELQPQELEVVGGVAEDSLPARTLPVSVTRRGSGCVTSAAPSALAGAADHVDDAGREVRPAPRAARSRAPTVGVPSCDLTTTVLPAMQRRADLAASSAPPDSSRRSAPTTTPCATLWIQICSSGIVGGDDVAGDPPRLLGGVGRDRAPCPRSRRAPRGCGLPCSATTIARQPLAVLEDQPRQVREEQAARLRRQRLPGGLRRSRRPARRGRRPRRCPSAPRRWSRRWPGSPPRSIP